MVSGRVSRGAAEATGLPEGLPVVGGGGDQAAGAVGNGIVETGIVSSTIGTSGVVFAFTERPRLDPQGRSRPSATPCRASGTSWASPRALDSRCGGYGTTSGMWSPPPAAGAASTRTSCWRREAEKAPAGCEGLIWLPYLMGERAPILDPDARGVLFGVTARH